jgi:hypothetical protein
MSECLRRGHPPCHRPRRSLEVWSRRPAAARTCESAAERSIRCRPLCCRLRHAHCAGSGLAIPYKESRDIVRATKEANRVQGMMTGTRCHCPVSSAAIRAAIIGACVSAANSTPLAQRAIIRKKRACFAIGLVLSVNSAICFSLSGVKLRANSTHSSTCCTVSHPMIALLIGNERV